MTQANKLTQVDLNFLQQFRNICGPYSLTAIKYEDRNNWSCSVYKGGRRLGTAYLSGLETKEGIVQYNLCAEDIQELSDWVDQAGPYGFLTIQEFLKAVMQWVQLLKEMDKLISKRYLVVVSPDWIDEHGMPTGFKGSKFGKVTEEWIKGYKRSYPKMVVINGMWI